MSDNIEKIKRPEDYISTTSDGSKQKENSEQTASQKILNNKYNSGTIEFEHFEETHM